MDRIGAITQSPGGLREHLNNAVSQGANMFMFIFYDLPNRDCAALASNGELLISQNGMARYKAEYVEPIVSILADFPQIRVVAIIEVDSLPNLVTNLSIAGCNEANGAGGYREGITYALNRLSTLPNVYSYLDIAHSGWLGWPNNFNAAAPMYEQVIEGTTNGWNSIAGFASASANYTPVEEPYLPDPNLNVGGQPVKSATFYEFNDYLEELDWVQDWRDAMISRGAPSSIGMLIDTGRSGWGGAGRPTGTSTSTVLNTYVDASRIDRRLHRGNWCNQRGGVGFRPTAAPAAGVDAYVWVKPQGESDGISDPNFEPDPNDPAKKHDPMCDPNANNRYNSAFKTGAMPNAPHAGRWFPEAFQVLLQNAFPPL
jgi:cellulose 1,4-beta-cellobiosidase